MKASRKPSKKKAPVKSEKSKQVNNAPAFRPVMLLPLVAAVLIIVATTVVFQKSEENGKYDLLNSLLLYLSIFAVGFLPIMYVFKKWKKVLLVNWTLIFAVIGITESYLRISNYKNILNYSEQNEGYFTTNTLQYEQSLQSRNDGNELYLNLGKDSNYVLDRPEYRFTYRLDEYGLNNCSTCRQNKASFNILTLGDSFTWGMGAAQGKSWPQQLQDMLLKRGFSNISVCNGGVQGSDPIYMLNALQNTYRNAFNPELMIVAINPSDIMDIVIRGGMNRYIYNKPAIENPDWLPWYASSLIYRLYKRSSDKIDADLLIPESLKGPMMYEAYTQLFETMLALRQEQAIRGKKVVFVYTPIMMDILNKASGLRDILAEAERQGMMIIDCTNYFIQKGVNASNLETYFWKKDSHNTAAGYQLIAEAVSDYLITQQLIPKNP
jgi:lysophospholipase L1-like esterase